MIEVDKNLFVGSQWNLEQVQKEPGWYIIHAAQIPWFRDLNINGLWYESGASLTLNLLDARDIKYIQKEVINKGIEAINNNRNTKIFIHCNMGLSRSPSIVFLYMLKHTNLLRKDLLEHSIEDFRKLYPQYSPGLGLQQFITLYYHEYIN